MEKVSIRIPASTSNLGPGFDCLGVALRFYNSITIARGGNGPVPKMAGEAARLFFNRTGRRSFSFSMSIRGDIPISRGLGSSVTVRLGVLHGLNELCHRPLDRLSIFQLCAQLEGHPDNSAPASFGGFTVARGDQVQRFPVSQRLGFILLVPDFEIVTRDARKVLPAKIGRQAAVENSANACAIAAAFASRNYKALHGVFMDQIHQPFRKRLIPFLPKVIAAAEKAGALGAFLSGSGSTICAIALQDRHRIAAAMLRAAGSGSARTIITTADNRGVTLTGR